MEYYCDQTNGNSNSWTDKYMPSKISEIVGNYTAVHNIVTWLNEFDKNKKQVLIAQQNNEKKKGKKKGGKKIKIAKIDDEIEIGEQEEAGPIEPICPEDWDDTIDESRWKELEEATKIQSVKKNPCSCMIVTGNHGVGKTSSVHAILTELNYEIQIINFNKIKTGKNIKDIIMRITNSSNILNIMDGRNNSKAVIVIDELESLTSSTEKSCIATLIKTNEQNWFCPMIFISNNQHNKLLSDIKKNSIEIRFWQPSPNDMTILLKKISEKEKIHFANSNVSIQIIDHAQKDFRRLVFILQNLKHSYGKEIITKDIVNDFCTSSKKKDIDFDLFKATDLLLHKYTSIDDCMRYYETEKVLLPLMIHQNYIKSINAVSNSENSISEIHKISELLSKGDVVENYIYGEQNWDMHEVHGFYTCVAPSFELSKLNPIEGSVSLDFPMDLNRTSIKKINKKNILKANKCLHDMDIYDYIYINQIVRKLLACGKTNQCMKMFEGYGIQLDHIESLLKIDKIQSSKTNLANKQKKELANYLDNN
jgi:DNA polymerase III delta prime subunit